MGSVIAPRVVALETTVKDHDEQLLRHNSKLQEHDQLLYGIKDCPGVVSDVVDIQKAIEKINLLLNSQTIYNKILTFFASALSLAIVSYLIKLVLK
ncbi:MAG: hypothetical protein C0391_03850 [Anaerolinea sp.]|nr:hypothetical protein [Anaerolinea sp.]